jgi:hypothetical protein
VLIKSISNYFLNIGVFSPNISNKSDQKQVNTIEDKMNLSTNQMAILSHAGNWTGNEIQNLFEPYLGLNCQYINNYLNLYDNSNTLQKSILEFSRISEIIKKKFNRPSLNFYIEQNVVFERIESWRENNCDALACEFAIDMKKELAAGIDKDSLYEQYVEKQHGKYVYEIWLKQQFDVQGQQELCSAIAQYIVKIIEDNECFYSKNRQKAIIAMGEPCTGKNYLLQNSFSIDSVLNAIPQSETYALIDPDDWACYIPGFHAGYNSMTALIWGKIIQSHIMKHFLGASLKPNIAIPMVGSQLKAIWDLLDSLANADYDIDVYYCHTEDANLGIFSRNIQPNKRILGPSIHKGSVKDTFRETSKLYKLKFHVLSHTKTILNNGREVVHSVPDDLLNCDTIKMYNV